MKPAPALNCAVCGRVITKGKGHYLTEDDKVVCGRLLRGQDRCVGKAGHTVLYPACPERWHDVLDHLQCVGTRAGIAAHLGLWP